MSFPSQTMNCEMNSRNGVPSMFCRIRQLLKYSVASYLPGPTHVDDDTAQLRYCVESVASQWVAKGRLTPKTIPDGTVLHVVDETPLSLLVERRVGCDRSKSRSPGKD